MHLYCKYPKHSKQINKYKVEWISLASAQGFITNVRLVSTSFHKFRPGPISSNKFQRIQTVPNQLQQVSISSMMYFHNIQAVPTSLNQFQLDSTRVNQFHFAHHSSNQKFQPASRPLSTSANKFKLVSTRSSKFQAVPTNSHDVRPVLISSQ